MAGITTSNHHWRDSHMNTGRILLCALSLLLVWGSAQADTEEELQALLGDYVTAVNELDLELGEKIWSQQQDISFIHPRGHQQGWDEIKKEFYQGTMGLFSQRKLVLRDISIRVLSEDTAWSDFYWDFEALFPDGKPLKTSGRESQVWKKEADGWKIVHVHYSGPAISGEGEGF